MKFEVRTFLVGGLNLKINSDYSDHKFIFTLLEAKILNRKLGDAIKKIELRDTIKEEDLGEEQF